MAGIYVHIPFCQSRCIYCSFYSTVDLKLRQRYVDAVCHEWLLRKDELAEPTETIYFGGGTPSQLTTSQLQQVLGILPTGAKEVTLECNPDDVTDDFADALSHMAVSRISMGAQTFDENRLRFLHRRHTANQVSDAVVRLRQAGIRNISIDLMYGFPAETLDEWRRDIDAALALNVEHISAYCLSIEEGTILHRMGIAPCEEEQELQMYELLTDLLTAAGYEHYEISNFALKTSNGDSWRSQHNSSYWHEVPYIGLGAAAHSFSGRYRQWNVSDINRYIKAIEQGQIPCERELLDDDTRYNDLVTVALRTSDGLDLNLLSEHHRCYCLKEAQRYIDYGLLRRDGERLILTRKGLFVSNDVMSSLIYV